MQWTVIGLASIAPTIITLAILGQLLGLVSTEQMIDTALAAGETPGMITFGAMFLASPVQWMTGRSQVRVRKFLGLVFFALALSNGAMFAIEQAIGDSFSEPFLVAGSLALLMAVPLAATSTRWSQRTMGMRRWRQLHRLTYVIAVALVAHVALTGEPDLGFLLIGLGAIARIPWVRRRLTKTQRPALD